MVNTSKQHQEDYLRAGRFTSGPKKMSDQRSISKKLIGVIVAAVILATWALVDLNLLSSIVGQYSYPIYELATYGSWFVIILVVLFICSWAGCIPERQQD